MGGVSFYRFIIIDEAVKSLKTALL